MDDGFIVFLACALGALCLGVAAAVLAAVSIGLAKMLVFVMIALVGVAVLTPIVVGVTNLRRVNREYRRLLGR